jgi:uncharacterized membrane protein YfcA
MELLAELGDIDHALYVIVFGSFLAAVCNTVFANGGAMIILAITSTVLPVAAIVPVHSTLLIGSTTARAIVFRQHIDWRIAAPFLVGSAIAVAIAARIYVELPETMIAAAIGIVMLVAIWLPGIRWRPKLRHPWAIVGFIHSFFSTLFAYGALLHAVILHTGLKRREIVGTMAASLTGMGLFKIAGYTWHGFDYSPYLQIIAWSIIAAFAGTWIGKFLIERVSETLFRRVFRLLVTVMALRMLYLAFSQGIEN